MDMSSSLLLCTSFSQPIIFMQSTVPSVLFTCHQPFRCNISQRSNRGSVAVDPDASACITINNGSLTADIQRVRNSRYNHRWTAEAAAPDFAVLRCAMEDGTEASAVVHAAPKYTSA
jgi:hypothetical protein